MSTNHIEPPELDVPQALAHDWINRHGIFRTVSTGGQKERTGTDWGMVITEAARWGQRQGWDARGAAEARQQADQKPPLGLMPRWLADEKRLADLDAALQRYRDANLEPPGEWLEERHDLVDSLRRHRPAEARPAVSHPPRRLWEAMEEAGRRELEDNPHAELAEFYEAMIRAVAAWLEEQENDLYQLGDALNLLEREANHA